MAHMLTYIVLHVCPHVTRTAALRLVLTFGFLHQASLFLCGILQMH